MTNKGDIESAWGRNNADRLYPMMLESPQLRWAFIRKVYAILCFQMLLTTAVAAVVVFVRPIPDFIAHTSAGLAVYIVICILPFIRNFLKFANLSLYFCFFLIKSVVGLIGVFLKVIIEMSFILCSFMPLVLLPQASPAEHVSSYAVHDLDCIYRGTCLCLYQRYISFSSLSVCLSLCKNRERLWSGFQSSFLLISFLLFLIISIFFHLVSCNERKMFK